MFTRINSSGIQGIGAYPVSVEADVANGLPGFSISGQLSTEVREAQERVRTALKNSGFQLPAKKITVNLSPAGVSGIQKLLNQFSGSVFVADRTFFL